MSRIAEQNVAIEPMNDSILVHRSTPCGIFSDSLKYWLQVCGEVKRDPQNLAGGGLLFQRFRELTVTFLQLFVLCFLPQQRFDELLRNSAIVCACSATSVFTMDGAVLPFYYQSLF